MEEILRQGVEIEVRYPPKSVIALSFSDISAITAFMDISSEQQRQISEIAQNHHLRMVLLFGSAVSGGEHARSDLDIAVQYEAGAPGFRQFSDLLHDLQEIFPEREVDLSSINHADPLFLKKITENCRLLYGAPGLLQRLKIYAFRRYQDHRRFFEMERKFVNRFLREMASSK